MNRHRTAAHTGGCDARYDSLAFYSLASASFLEDTTPVYEALSRCVTETYAAMYYRTLAAYTHDAELKALLTQLSRDEIQTQRSVSAI